MSTVLMPEAPAIETAPEPGTVAYEAKRLDRLFPGWHNNVNTAQLDLTSCERCVIGQAVGWDYGFQIVFSDRLRLNQTLLSSRGLYADSEHEPEWINEIDRRRAAA